MEYKTFTNPIGIRLKQEMRKHAINSTDLAKKSGVLTSFLYDVISGKSNNPSTIKLARVADALGVDLNYLVSGVEENSTSKSGDYVTIPRVVVAPTPDGGNIVSREEDGEAYSFRKEWISRHLGANIEDLRLLTISGDGMNPSLCHGDTVIIDVSKKHPSPPAIFVLFDGFGLVAKRCEYIGAENVRITSDNSHYSAYEKSINKVEIVGRVVWFAREI